MALLGYLMAGGPGRGPWACQILDCSKSDPISEAERAPSAEKTKTEPNQRMREEANQAVDHECHVCWRAPACHESIYPNIGGILCDTCHDAEIAAADPDYIDAMESETEMPRSVALEFSLKANGNAAVIHERRAAKAHRHKPPGPNMGL